MVGLVVVVVVLYLMVIVVLVLRENCHQHRMGLVWPSAR